MRRLLTLAVLGLAGYGGYVLWNRLGGRSTTGKIDRRVGERSELNVTEWAAGTDNPVAQATAILADSDERSELSRDAPGIERRRSQDTVEP